VVTAPSSRGTHTHDRCRVGARQPAVGNRTAAKKRRQSPPDGASLSRCTEFVGACLF
jgi:hypothetical protein